MINKKYFIILIMFPIFLYASLVLLFKNSGETKKKYQSYELIPSDDGILSWLPEFFPHSASNIRSFTNLDFNYGYFYFTLTADNASQFESILNKKALELQIKELSNLGDFTSVWCKESKISLNKNIQHVIFFVAKMRNKNNEYLLYHPAENGDDLMKICK